MIYAHTDRMNVVYYSRYYEFFEAARSAFLRDIGFPYAKMEAEGYLLPVVESHCRHYRGATFEDELTVVTRLETLPKVKITLTYEVFKEGTESAIAEGYTVHSFVDPQLKPVKAPAAFIEALKTHAGQELGG